MLKTNLQMQKQAYSAPDVQVVRLQMENGLCVASQEGFVEGDSYDWSIPSALDAFDSIL